MGRSQGLWEEGAEREQGALGGEGTGGASSHLQVTEGIGWHQGRTMGTRRACRAGESSHAEVGTVGLPVRLGRASAKALRLDKLQGRQERHSQWGQACTGLGRVRTSEALASLNSTQDQSPPQTLAHPLPPVYTSLGT